MSSANRSAPGPRTPALSTARQQPLAQLLASRRLLPLSEVEACVERATQERRPFEDVLVESGRLTARQLLQFLENEHFCPAIELSRHEPDLGALQRLPRELADRLQALPLRERDEVLHVAVADPSDAKMLAAIRAGSHREITAHVALGSDLQRAITRAYDFLDEHLRELVGEAPKSASAPQSTSGVARPISVPADPGRPLRIESGFSIEQALRGANTPVEAVKRMVAEAVRLGATDIHLQPQADGFWCRLRIDGVLRNTACLPLDRAPGVVSHLKILAGMDIAEHRRAQDGRTTYDVEGRSIDLRVSCVASQFGEKIVARLLERQQELLSLDKLSMPPAVRSAYENVLRSPLGLFLVTGPTGSGKTTTLYATLQSLDRAQLNISTLEDPIEYSLPGITQIQINEEIGNTFAQGLRALLRQDPDVILLGEIRDRETAEIACRAALTGHKVLSTVHTNDACQAITRLVDMGVPSHLLSATLRGVLGQRLVRRTCGSCKEEVAMTDLDRALLGYPTQETIHRGRGCDDCGGTGYRGRVGIYEYFELGNTMHRLIQEGASPFAIRYAAQKEGMLSMSDFARHAVLDGTTTVAEIQRVVLSDEPHEQLCHTCQRVVDLEYAVCPYCHATLKDNCPSCKRAVEPTWEGCAHCGEVLVREWQRQYCRQCLAPVEPEWTNCHYCNAEIAS
jgi:type IV pilus assembly protein PilB